MPLLASEAVEPNVYFTAADFDAQSVWANIEWQTLFPIDPVFPHHLMLVCQRRRAVKYSDLTDGEAISLRDAVAHLDTRYRRHFSAAYIGYNLFSNNGDPRIGQHMQHFHQHVFLRTTDEPASPYELMGRGRAWAQMGSRTWQAQFAWLRQTLA